MKLVHPDIDNQFFNDGRINVLTVENGRLFRELCETIKYQSEGMPGMFVLSEGDDILQLSKYCIYISDYFDLSLSDKKYIAKLHSMICADSDSKLSLQTAETISAFCALLDKLNSECDIPFMYDESVQLAAILKAFNVKPLTEYSSFLERLVSYIEAVISLTSVKIFCFVNLKANLAESELQQLYQYFHTSEIFVLLLESSFRNKRDDEWNVLIDNDLCEITA